VFLSALIPAFNEESSVSGTIAAIRQTLTGVGIEHEIIVIDDGSTDGTGKTAEAAGAKLLRHPANGGYGRALKTGLREAAGEWVVIADADGSYPTEKIPELLGFVPAFDMVVGARSGTHYRGSLFKWWGRKVLTMMVRFVTGVNVPDVNSGLRVFRKAVALRNLDRIGNGFSFTTTLTLAMLLEGHFIRYVSIPYHARVGRSKVRFRRDVLRTLQIVVVAIVAYNPIKLFLLLVQACLVIALGCLVLDAVLARGTHAALILAVMGGTAVLVFSLGLIADLLRRLPMR
jgi:glycosyltransferase involved in cell wall biosynthesis